MTTMFGTYRGAGRMPLPGVFAVRLRAFDFQIVFLAGGAVMSLLTLYSKFLPQRH